MRFAPFSPPCALPCVSSCGRRSVHVHLRYARTGESRPITGHDNAPLSEILLLVALATPRAAHGVRHSNAAYPTQHYVGGVGRARRVRGGGSAVERQGGEGRHACAGRSSGGRVKPPRAVEVRIRATRPSHSEDTGACEESVVRSGARPTFGMAHRRVGKVKK